MKKSFGSSLFVLVIFAAILYARSVYRTNHPSPSVIMVPAHVVGYTPGADYEMVLDEKTNVVSQISSFIDPITHKLVGKIDPKTKVGDKGTLVIKFPQRTMEFRPDPK